MLRFFDDSLAKLQQNSLLVSYKSEENELQTSIKVGSLIDQSSFADRMNFNSKLASHFDQLGQKVALALTNGNSIKLNVQIDYDGVRAYHNDIALTKACAKEVIAKVLKEFIEVDNKVKRLQVGSKCSIV